MPIYEYRCPECGREFERIVANDKAEVRCPSCGRQKVERLLSSFAVRGGSRRKSGCAPSAPS
ncbi:MAG: zinc ribbon domain-containing protein [Acidobacteriota bacterium]